MSSPSAPTPQAGPNVAAAAAAVRIAFCPTCMTRAKVPATLAQGKRVRCPKCQIPYDPFSASAAGTDRMKVKEALAKGEDPGLPEWVWALIIGGGSGIATGTLLGYIVGMLIQGAVGAGAADGVLSSVVFWTILGAVGYAMYGSAISMAMLLTGTSWAGYAVACLGVLPACFIFGLGLGRWGVAFGMAVTLGYAVAIERMIDNKLYS